VQHEAKQLVSHCREEWIIAVDNPFQSRSRIAECDGSTVDKRELPEPDCLISPVAQSLNIEGRGGRYSLFAVMKNIDITRIAGCRSIQRRGSGHVAFGIAVRCEEQENVALDFRQRHGTPVR